ncbi:Equilibrative Nucleoside Transporter (ENT) Family [Phytophthora cinnamomi]|uniref:Equilibrative Nucleoside Transporter (ENT) Family n=1 Tax=Phytophthora cinnamomi TaxID=4785 RepID=UPI00355AA927|nr:Equilibrative Nucleoside Transporter (ENT) Family [Phytophthora cinnamomi]KAG6615265.1 Equilibrative Nucleoside Transporter (ENT) Family [Phytophthora cinnamomi]
MPEDVYQDFITHQQFIFFALMYLNGTALWAYFSFLSTQDYFSQRFANSGMDFSFLTTLCQSWPMVISQTTLTLTGLDKKLGQRTRMNAGYWGFFASSALVIILCGIEFMSEKTTAILVLVCIGLTGICSALTESTYYSMAALLPDPKFTTSVQIGNGAAGIVNVTLLTVLRLAVGGIQESSDSVKLSFYLFFGLLLLIVLSAILLYRRLMSMPCIKFVMNRDEEFIATSSLCLSSSPPVFGTLFHVFKIIWVPLVAEFLVFFVSFTIYPGVGCAAARNLAEPYMEGDHDITKNWFCSPGIIGSFQYGDFFGRALPMFFFKDSVNTNSALTLSILRVVFVPLLLMGIAVTMRQAPTMLDTPDRESGGSLVAMFFFWGVTLGSTLGFFVDGFNILGV